MVVYFNSFHHLLLTNTDEKLWETCMQVRKQQLELDMEQ